MALKVSFLSFVAGIGRKSLRFTNAEGKELRAESKEQGARSRELGSQKSEVVFALPVICPRGTLGRSRKRKWIRLATYAF